MCVETMWHFCCIKCIPFDKNRVLQKYQKWRVTTVQRQNVSTVHPVNVAGGNMEELLPYSTCILINLVRIRLIKFSNGHMECVCVTHRGRV